MPIALLPDRAVVMVSGEPATTFLQGILTCNVETLPEGEARLGALLTPQGKIQFDFLVSRAGDGFRLDTATALVPDLVKRLTLYRLRAKVTIALDPAQGVAVAWGGAQPRFETVRCRDGRVAGLGDRLYGAEDAVAADAAEQEYHAHRIALGVPDGGRDFAFGDAFPHEALMDQLGGVDFRKGCYVGQEVVSRMQHRGTARTRILPLVYADGSAPEPGSAVTAGARSLGSTGSAANGRGLAAIRLDRLGDALAAGEPVRAGGHIAGVEKPAFATFAFPADAAAPAG